MRKKIGTKSSVRGLINPLWTLEIDKNLLRSTMELWSSVVEDELLDDLDSEIVLGAHYAKLCMDGTVNLTEAGNEKIKAAHAALTQLVLENQ